MPLTRKGGLSYNFLKLKEVLVDELVKSPCSTDEEIMFCFFKFFKIDSFAFYSAVLLFPMVFFSNAWILEAAAAEKLKISTAVMCEDIQDRQPKNEGVVFSIGKGKIFCYNIFENVSEKSTITHNWYNRDNLSTKIKLNIQPPRWATYSTIQLRESDKGPWKVEITDSEDKIIKILRFSVVD